MPRSRGWQPSWGAPTVETCPAFAYKWCSRHAYENSSHNKTAGPKIPRDQFQQLTEDMVDWEPYTSTYTRLSIVTQAEMPFYLYCGPLIFYWIVEHHHPNRCMRQFGKFQEILPPFPLNKHVHNDLHKLKMASKRNISWADKHAIHMEKANAYEQNIHKEVRQFDRNKLPNYRKWYQMNGMASVYLFGMHVDGLDRAVLVSRDEHGKGGYIPSGSLIIRIALRGMGELAHGVAMFFTKGWRRVGKTNMRRGWGFCCDSGFEDRARALMDQAGVPNNWEDVSSNESTELGVNPYPPPPIFELPDPLQSWLYDGTGWRNYMKQAGVPLVADPGQVTQDQQAQELADIIIPSLAQGIFVGPHVSAAYDIHRGNDPRNMETQTQPEVAQDEESDRRPTQRLRREVHSPDRFSHS